MRFVCYFPTLSRCGKLLSSLHVTKVPLVFNQDRAAVRYRQGDKGHLDAPRSKGPSSSLLLTVPTISGSAGGPRLSTDMSSISEDIFSSRRMSTEDTSADMDRCPTATLVKVLDEADPTLAIAGVTVWRAFKVPVVSERCPDC